MCVTFFQFTYDTLLHFWDYYLIISKHMNSLKFEYKRELDRLIVVQYLQQLGFGDVLKESLERRRFILYYLPAMNLW